MRQFIGVLLIVLMSGTGSNVTLAAQEKRLTLQEQVAQIPGGAIVKAKLKTKETVQGRLGEVTSAGYTVQVTQGDKLETRQIAFEETKSIKQVQQGSKTGLWVALGIVGGAALVIGLLAAAYAANS